jgi:glycosyltransferase involved in cell wall biosynthesis
MRMSPTTTALSAGAEPTLSILVPHYNDPEGLALSLASIEAQTWQGPREVVVVDDGSKPEHQAGLDEVVAQSRERVRLIRSGINRGRPYTRNVLLDAAAGKYLTWLDAGDEYYPGKIEWQLEGLYRARLEHPGDAVWCTCHSHWHWQRSKAKKKLIPQGVDGDQASNLFLGSMRGYLYTLMGTTQSFRDVGYFDLALPRLQDIDFFLRFVEKGGRFVLPPTAEPLCLYHKTDVGRRGEEVLRCNRYLLRKHSLLLMQHSRRYRRNRTLQQYELAARFTLNNGEHLKTALLLARGALTHPIGLARFLVKSRGKL